MAKEQQRKTGHTVVNFHQIIEEPARASQPKARDEKMGRKIKIDDLQTPLLHAWLNPMPLSGASAAVQQQQPVAIVAPMAKSKICKRDSIVTQFVRRVLSLVSLLQKSSTTPTPRGQTTCTPATGNTTINWSGLEFPRNSFAFVSLFVLDLFTSKDLWDFCLVYRWVLHPQALKLEYVVSSDQTWKGVR